ncbi:MAG TPA: CADD family putative folate metabolism protein [Oligoflexia bacterium]|nr:CADD family putative folate metabolism protein [Oligoflexia bacterium]HMR25409.1 CADD family putative folate metabolism protein [Oligoflexia bacterium]
MSFSQQLKQSIAGYHLLEHLFYQKWTEGQLNPETLQHYAKEYYQYVKAFPRYISATHSLCEDITKRKVLLENLNEEEGSMGKDHPQLWSEFATGVGASEESLQQHTGGKAINHVIDTFFKCARSSYSEGLASLYAYEYQVPEVAKTKIDGLKKFYAIDDEKSLAFFKVHQSADVIHREACENLLDQFSPAEQNKALQAAKNSAKALWNFLTEMNDYDEKLAC